MRHLTRRERQKICIGPTNDITEAEAEGIAKLEPILPAGALSWGYRALKIGPFCGVLQTKQLAIEIIPKIDYGSDSDESMRGLLVALLARAGELGSKWVGDAGLGQQRRHLLDVFIEDFCDQVKTALQRGAIVRYSERTENLNTIRGRLELTEHLRVNAIDHSHLFCRFDELNIDNPYNQALKGTLRILLRFALSSRIRTMVATLLHRFDGVRNRKITVRDIDDLSFDRTIRHWKAVFARARWLLSGLYPDVRTGSADGSALLFNMEKLFETVLGRCIRDFYQAHPNSGVSVGLQGPVKCLATPGFRLKPDITIQNQGETVAIFDAKWKDLNPKGFNSGVLSGDAYQLNAYASRYRCKRLALVYPASAVCPPGKVNEFVLATEERPTLEIISIDIRELAHTHSIPANMKEIVLNQ